MGYIVDKDSIGYHKRKVEYKTFVFLCHPLCLLETDRFRSNAPAGPIIKLRIFDCLEVRGILINMKVLQKSENLNRLISIPVLPVIGLYLLAYRLLGISATYHLGEFDVRPLQPVTRNQFRFSRIFPAIVAFVGLGLLVIVSHALGKPINPFF